VQGSSALLLRKDAQAKGMRLLSDDGVAKALAGLTTIEEVSRVCSEQSEAKPEKIPPAISVSKTDTFETELKKEKQPEKDTPE